MARLSSGRRSAGQAKETVGGLSLSAAQMQNGPGRNRAKGSRSHLGPPELPPRKDDLFGLSACARATGKARGGSGPPPNLRAMCVVRRAPPRPVEADSWCSLVHLRPFGRFSSARPRLLAPSGRWMDACGSLACSACGLGSFFPLSLVSRPGMCGGDKGRNAADWTWHFRPLAAQRDRPKCGTRASLLRY